MFQAALFCAALSGAAKAQLFLDPEQLVIGNGGQVKAAVVPTIPDIDIPPPQDGAELTKPKVKAVSTLARLCGIDRTAPDEIRVDDIRAISDEFCAAGNPSSNGYGLTNMMWAFGQFIDHDITATIEETDHPAIEVPGMPGHVMKLHRVKYLKDKYGRNKRPFNVHSAAINGGAIYGEDKKWEAEVLREPRSCRLRESAPGFLPVTTAADKDGKFKWIAGDARVDEHAVLTAMHTLWLREHNRLCGKLERNFFLRWRPADHKYRMVKSTVIAKLQQVAMNEFLPAFGITKAMLRASRPKRKHSKISVEFSVAYRLGHTMIPDALGGMPVKNLFDGQAFFLNEAGSSVGVRGDAEANIKRIFTALAYETCAELDGKMSDALRNVLFGPNFQEDLAARNIFRGRDLKIPSYARLAQCFGVKPDPKTRAHTPDAWLGLLMEPRKTHEPLGPTHKAMLIEQFARLFYSRYGGLWWKHSLRHHVWPFRREIKRSTLAKIIRHNTNAVVYGNVFKLAPDSQ